MSVYIIRHLFYQETSEIHSLLKSSFEGFLKSESTLYKKSKNGLCKALKDDWRGFQNKFNSGRRLWRALNILKPKSRAISGDNSSGLAYNQIISKLYSVKASSIYSLADGSLTFIPLTSCHLLDGTAKEN